MNARCMRIKPLDHHILYVFIIMFAQNIHFNKNQNQQKKNRTARVIFTFINGRKPKLDF